MLLKVFNMNRENHIQIEYFVHLIRGIMFFKCKTFQISNTVIHFFLLIFGNWYTYITFEK